MNHLSFSSDLFLSQVSLTGQPEVRQLANEGDDGNPKDALRVNFQEGMEEMCWYSLGIHTMQQKWH